MCLLYELGIHAARWLLPHRAGTGAASSAGFAARGCRAGCLGIFILAEVITPPDMVSQLMRAIPMCLLYELGIHAVRWLLPRQAGTGAASSAGFAARGLPRRLPGHLHPGGGDHTAGHGLATDGRPDVPALRAGHPRRALATCRARPGPARRPAASSAGLAARGCRAGGGDPAGGAVRRPRTCARDAGPGPCPEAPDPPAPARGEGVAGSGAPLPVRDLRRR